MRSHRRDIGLDWHLNESLRKIVSESLQGHRVPRAIWRPRSMRITDGRRDAGHDLELMFGERHGGAVHNRLPEGRRPPARGRLKTRGFSIRLAPDASICRSGLERAWEAPPGYPSRGFTSYSVTPPAAPDSLELTGRMTQPASAEAARIHARRAATPLRWTKTPSSAASPLNRN